MSVVRADEKLTAFMELESAIRGRHKNGIDSLSGQTFIFS
jgi:hypothetical protein